MKLLTDLFREKVGSLKDSRMKNETEQDVAYPTGFLSFDFLNGTVIHVKSDEMDFTYNSVGIIDGSMVTVIGRSGCGKTTFILQSAGDIIRPFENSCIYHDDNEGGIVQQRKELLTKLSGEEFEKRYIARNSGVTAENFFERLKILHDLKLENREDFEYDTGLYDSQGKRIYKLVPTVYILDSLAMLMPEKFTEEEELSGQMSTTAAAKTNAAVFRRIIPMLKAANIILFVVNHITEAISINPYERKKAQVSYLKPDESLGGGRVATYVTNLLVRLDDNTKLKETEGLGVRGSIVEVTLLKSRTSAAGRSINLVFDFANGFDKELSLLLMLKEQGLVVARGAYMRLVNNEDIKFTQKQFKEKLQTDAEFQRAIMEQVQIGLMNLITVPVERTNIENNSFDISAALLSNMNKQVA